MKKSVAKCNLVSPLSFTYKKESIKIQSIKTIQSFDSQMF